MEKKKFLRHLEIITHSTIDKILYLLKIDQDKHIQIVRMSTLAVIDN